MVTGGVVHIFIAASVFYVSLALAQDLSTRKPIDYSCGADSDCVIKNVGNCCGYYPKCVNKDFTPGPACPDGGMGVCGFPTIDYCRCEAGQCKNSATTTGDGVAIMWITCVVIALTWSSCWQ